VGAWMDQGVVVKYKRFYTGIIYENIDYKVGDAAYLNPINGSSKWICRIEKFWEDKKDPEQYMTIRWYYKVEDVRDYITNIQFHENELIITDHFDDNPISALFGKCEVVELTNQSESDVSGKHKYFYQYFMNCRTKKISPMDMQIRGRLAIKEIRQSRVNHRTTAHGSSVQKEGSLANDFLIPPFSVFRTDKDYWRHRKTEWQSTGLEDTEGRNLSQRNLTIHSTNLMDSTFYDKKAKVEQKLGHEISTGAFIRDHYVKSPTYKPLSAFDPVLCEVIYRWFCPSSGSVLDPFAGGCTRGTIAACYELQYTGIELLKKQIQKNEEQAQRLRFKKKPNWIHGDSRNIVGLIKKHSKIDKFDFVFSCPPYFDLEYYSDNDKDLSNCPDYETFLEDYKHIIKNTVSLLKNNRFACFVVANIRSKQAPHHYHPLEADTIKIFQKYGMQLYNDVILLNSSGSKRFGCRRTFEASLKVSKVHQNVLVFLKGTWLNVPPTIMRQQLVSVEQLVSKATIEENSSSEEDERICLIGEPFELIIDEL